MSRSNRRRNDQIKIGVGAAFILVTLLVLTWMLARLDASYDQQAEYAATQYAERTRARIDSTCQDREAVAFAKCVQEIVESTHEAKTSERDLGAQQRMALWAAATFGATVASVIVTTIGIGFVIKTLRVSVGQLHAARVANKITADAFAFERRAWMRAGATFSNGRITIEDKKLEITSHPNFTNQGQTPARDVVIETEVIGLEGYRLGHGRLRFWVTQQSQSVWQKGDIVFPNEKAPTEPVGRCILNESPGPGRDDYPSRFQVKFICRYKDGTSNEPRVTSLCYTLRASSITDGVWVDNKGEQVRTRSLFVEGITEMPNSREVT